MLLSRLLSPYFIPQLLAAIIAAMLLVYALRNRSAPGVQAFLYLMVFALIFVIGYGLSLISTSLDAKVFWAKIEVLGYSVPCVIWLIIALQYTGKERWLTRGRIILLSIFPLVSFIFALTNERHKLFWSQISLNTDTTISTLDLVPGVWFWLDASYTYTLLGITIILLVMEFVRTSRLYRGQILAMLGALFLPMIANVLYNSGLNPFPNLDLTPASLSFSSLLIAWGLFRYQLFDIVPIARNELIERMWDGVIVLDAENRILDLNPSAQEIMNLIADETVGKQVEEVFYPFSDWMKSEVEKGETQIEIGLEKDKKTRYYELHISNLTNRHGKLTGRMITMRDISERKEFEEKLRFLATTDSLTGLFNRHHFFTTAQYELERSIRYGHPLSIIMIDVDHFKLVNDNHGHLAGDLVLQSLAGLCQDNTRQVDVLGRYGGEEFVILLPETDLDRARQTAERLRESVENFRLETAEGDISITISAGIACREGDDDLTIDQMLARADQALYLAKGKGRNHVAVWEES